MSVSLAAWHGSQVFKDRILDLLREDQENDRFTQGIYLDNPGADGEFRGCHIGCLMMATLRVDRFDQPEAVRRPLPELVGSIVVRNADLACDWHDHVPDKLGMPADLARFWDSMFEAVTKAQASEFTIQSLESIPPGADLSNVLLKLIIWMTNQTREKETTLPDDFKALIPDLITLLDRRLTDGHHNDAEWTDLYRRLRASEGPVEDPYESAILCAAAMRSHHEVNAVASNMVNALTPWAPDPDPRDEFPWLAAEQLFILCAQAPIIGAAAVAL